MEAARLLFPAIRWQGARGFEPQRDIIESGLERGVGGFILFGGRAEAVRSLTDELQRRSAQPLLIGADLERGAGQQFEGATPLPPLAAIGALDDPEVTRRAGELTAREARAVGVSWVYAPVADLDIEVRNPIVGTRAFGADPRRVATHVVAWIEGCHDGGALCCVKHFPGHGRTVEDSHLGLPRVDADREELEIDLIPFRAALEAGVDSVMTAHVAYPALDPTGDPATLSHAILSGLLRRDLGYRGLIVTDALIMKGVLGTGASEGGAAIRALAAGCDALLYPNDLDAIEASLAAASAELLPPGRIEDALARLDAAIRRARATAGSAVAGVTRAARGTAERSGPWGAAGDIEWAHEIALRSVRSLRGRAARGAADAELVTIDDDLGGPFPTPSRDTLPAALRAHGVSLSGGSARRIIAVYCDIRGWKGRPGISEPARQRVRELAAGEGGRGGPDGSSSTVVLFGHPRLAEALEVPDVVCAWGGEVLMQEAAAAWLATEGASEPT